MSFENVSVGDKLIVAGRIGGDAIVTVERLTDTQIVANGLKYHKKDGRKVGASGWRAEWLMPFDERRAAVLRAKRARVMIAESAHRLNDEDAIRVWNIVSDALKVQQ